MTMGNSPAVSLFENTKMDIISTLHLKLAVTTSVMLNLDCAPEITLQFH